MFSIFNLLIDLELSLVKI